MRVIYTVFLISPIINSYFIRAPLWRYMCMRIKLYTDGRPVGGVSSLRLCKCPPLSYITGGYVEPAGIKVTVYFYSYGLFRSSAVLENALFAFYRLFFLCPFVYASVLLAVTTTFDIRIIYDGVISLRYVIYLYISRMDADGKTMEGSVWALIDSDKTLNNQASQKF